MIKSFDLLDFNVLFASSFDEEHQLLPNLFFCWALFEQSPEVSSSAKQNISRNINGRDNISPE